VVGGAALNFAAFFVSQLMTYTYGHWVFNFESSSGGDGGQSLIGTSSTNVTLMN
jgi:hypothetical protein